MAKKTFGITFHIFFVILMGINIPINAYTQDRESIAKEELQGIVSLMEDPQKREAFLKDLKNLVEIQQTMKAEGAPGPDLIDRKKQREIFFIENLFSKFETISGKIIQGAHSTALWLSKSPEALQKTWSFLAQPENRRKAFILVMDTLLSIILGVGLWGFFLKTAKEKVMKSGLRLSMAPLQVIFAVSPYAIIMVSLFVLFRFVPAFPAGHSLILLFFTTLLFYRLATEIFRAFLSPDDRGRRILPFSDETANYLWVWVFRFALYTSSYAFATTALRITEVSDQTYLFIRGLMLMVFPCMISVLIMQLSRDLKSRYANSPKRDQEQTAEGAKHPDILKRILPYLSWLAVAYSWAVFIFLLINFDRGFHYLFAATLWTALTVLFLIVGLSIQERMFKKFFAINERVKERLPGLEERTNRYISVLRRSARAFLMIVGISIIAQVWGIPISSMVASKTGSLVILRGIAILITAGIVMAIIETSQFISENLLGEKTRKRKRPATQKMKTLIPVINMAVKIAASFVGGLIILDRVGVNITPILAGAGIVGLAVGFGSQTLVKDLINGLFILFEESIRVGDYADLGKNEGIVEAIGLRTVKLRDVSGNVHVIPNSAIESLTNMSKEFSRTVIDVGVAYREDVDEVIEILKGVGEDMRKDPEYGNSIIEPMEVFGLHKFDDSAVVIRVRMTTKPLKQWGIKREFNRRVKKVFDRLGIEIPFPHRTIYMGEPKKGFAPPINVHLGEDRA